VSSQQTTGSDCRTFYSGEMRLGPEENARSCTSPLRIIPSAQKPGTMPHLTTLWRGQGHGLASFLLPTRSVSDRMALRHVASPGVQAKPARPTRAGQAQTQAFYRAQSVRGPDA